MAKLQLHNYRKDRSWSIRPRMHSRTVTCLTMHIAPTPSMRLTESYLRMWKITFRVAMNSRGRDTASGVVRDRSSIGERRLRPSARCYQGRPANNSRPGFERITQRDSTQLNVAKSPQGFTKDRMNPFDLKSPLLA